MRSWPAVLALLLPACAEEPAASAPSEEAALAAWRAGEAERALLALDEAMSVGAPPATMVLINGGYAGLLRIPGGELPWQTDLRRAVELLDEGAREEALSLLMRVLADAPDLVEGWFYYGVAGLEESSDGRAAEQAFSRALAADPGCWPCLVGRAVALERMGSLAAARVEFDRAAAVQPDAPLVNYYRARWALRDGKRDEAASLLGRNR